MRRSSFVPRRAGSAPWWRPGFPATPSSAVQSSTDPCSRNTLASRCGYARTDESSFLTRKRLWLDPARNFAYFVGLLEDASTQAGLVAVDLATGERTLMDPGSGRVRYWGGIRRAVYREHGTLWLLDGPRMVQVAQGVTDTLAPAEHWPDAPRPASAEIPPTVLVVTSEGLYKRLGVWDVSASRLYWLTDRLLYVDGAPRRSVAVPSYPPYADREQWEGAHTTYRYVAFGEISESDPERTTIFVAPTDGTSPPRPVMEIPTEQADRTYVFVSTDGTRLAVWQGTDTIGVGTLSVGSLQR